jgi:hypothetical protein
MTETKNYDMRKIQISVLGIEYWSHILIYISVITIYLLKLNEMSDENKLIIL